MRRVRVPAIALALAATVSALPGCGFQPLYASRNGNPAASIRGAALVAIAPIPDRLGQMVRNHLLDSLNTYGEPTNPTHRLDVKLELSEEGVGYRTDEAVTRYNVRLNAFYRLTDISSGKVVLENRARGFVAYDVVLSQFATVVAKQNAELRAANEVSEDISARVSLFFARKD